MDDRLSSSGGGLAADCGKSFRSSSSLNGEIPQSTKIKDLIGSSFCEIVTSHNIYGFFINVKTEFEIIVVHGQCRRLHWLLLVKMKGAAPIIPYISIEITTLNLKNVIPTMRTFVAGDIEAEFSGQMDNTLWNGKLQTLCQEADKVAKEMVEYNLLTNNCQHFCNNLL